MGPDNLGIYATVFAVIQLLRLPTSLGMPALVVRYAASYEAEQRWELLRGLLRRSLQYTLIVSSLLSVVAITIVVSLRKELGEVKTATFVIGLLMLPLLDLSILRNAALQGLRRVVLAQIPDGLIRPFLFLSALLLVWLFGRDFPVSPSLAMSVQLGCLMLVFILGSIFLVKSLPSPVREATPHYADSQWRKTLVPFMFLGAGQLLLSQTDILVLGVMSGDRAAGLYKVAWQGAELVVFMLGIVNLVIQPMVSRLYVQGDYQRLQNMLTKTARLSLLFAMPTALILWLFGDFLIVSVFGDAYYRAYYPMAILVAGQVFNGFIGSVTTLLNMTGHERDAAIGIGFSAFLNLSLDVLLIPVWGVEGASVATAISLVVWNLLMFKQVKKHLNINPSAFSLRVFR